MKGLWICLLILLLGNSVHTRRAIGPFDPEKKVFIITLDGFRWQEVFYGADSVLLEKQGIFRDELNTIEKFWHPAASERRKKLLPFIWNIAGSRGQIYGNRDAGNYVDVANPYGLSFPGYSELLTGKVNLAIYNNSRKKNTNPNILDRLNNEAAYRGKVAAFTSWDMFPYILNSKKGSVVLNSNYQGHQYSVDLSKVKNLTRNDVHTYKACRDYVLKKKPSLVFLSFSGTDDAGHDANYEDYLQQAHHADQMIGALWQMVQSMPEYAGKTSFVITTDHGRGNDSSNWNDHGFFVPGSSNAWLVLLGPSIVAEGEMKLKGQVYQKNTSDLVFKLLGK